MDCIACTSKNTKTFKFWDGIIYSCKSCRLQWADCQHPNKEYNPPSYLIQYHSPDSIDILQYEPYKQFSSFVDQQFSQMKQLSILDVGCGNGNFLRWAINLGYQCKGIEIDEKYREVLGNDVLTHISFTAAEHYKPEGDTKFDVITFWDCFEHIQDPFSLINRLKEYLNPEGIVYVRVNNRRDIYNFATDVLLQVWPRMGQTMLRRCFGFNIDPYAHLWNFSYKGMYELLKNNGWKIIEHSFSDTPAERLTANSIFSVAFKMAYLVNSCFGGGKIGDYYITSQIDRR